VMDHIQWVEASLNLALKKRSINDLFKRNRSELINLAKTKFQEAREEIMVNKEKMAELAETKARCEELRLKLEQLRPMRDEKNEAEMLKQRELEEEKQREMAKLAELAEKAQRTRREAVNKYHEEKKVKELQRKREEEELAVQLEAQRLAQRAIDESRVEYRSEKRKQQIQTVQNLRWQAQVCV
jgi:hypothetical protein